MEVLLHGRGVGKIAILFAVSQFILCVVVDLGRNDELKSNGIWTIHDTGRSYLHTMVRALVHKGSHTWIYMSNMLSLEYDISY